MVEKLNTIIDANKAFDMAHKEKPYRDLAIEVDKITDQPGMLNAYSTIIDLARVAADEVPRGVGQHVPQRPSSIPEHQDHVVQTAHKYAQVVTAGLIEPEIAYNESNYSQGTPIVANRTKEVMDIWGVTANVGRKRAYKTRIPDVNLRLHDHLGAVTVFVEPAKKSPPRRK